MFYQVIAMDKEGYIIEYKDFSDKKTGDMLAYIKFLARRTNMKRVEIEKYDR